MAPPALNQTGVQPVEILVRDGVRLAHVERRPDRPAGPPLVFIHGWAGDHGFLAPQLDHFAGNHHVIGVDLRGHGASDAPRQNYTVDGFVDDLCWQIGRLGLHKPVIIGHSMGGNIALQLAARRPDVPAAIVMIDTVLFPPDAVRGSLPAIGQALGGSHYREAMLATASRLFADTDDPDRKAALVERMVGTAQHVAVPAFVDHLLAFDAAAVAAACRVPAAYIGATVAMADLTVLDTAIPGLVTARVLGSGHFPQLEVPGQVNAMIARFLALLPARPEEAYPVRTDWV
jgi:pimeloyl-ACP methyl ester carboxylesterase